MPAVVIRDLPAVLHERLKAEPKHHHRSMNREVIAILEKELGGGRPVALPPPVKLRKPVDPQWIADVIREARDSNPYYNPARPCLLDKKSVSPNVVR